MCCSLTHAAIFPSVFFFNATAPTEIYTLSLHDALPISGRGIVGLLGLPGDHSVLHVDLPGAGAGAVDAVGGAHDLVMAPPLAVEGVAAAATDRKSTRLNSSHVAISYAVFCLKKKQYCQYVSSNVTDIHHD